MTNKNESLSAPNNVATLKPVRLPHFLEAEYGRDFIKDFKKYAGDLEEYESFVADPEIHRSDINPFLNQSGVFRKMTEFITKYREVLLLHFDDNSKRMIHKHNDIGAIVEEYIKDFTRKFSSIDKNERPILREIIDEFIRLFKVKLARHHIDEGNIVSEDAFNLNSFGEINRALSTVPNVMRGIDKGLGKEVVKIRKDIEATSYGKGNYDANILISRSGEVKCTHLTKVNRDIKKHPFTVMNMKIYFDPAGSNTMLKGTLSAMNSFLNMDGSSTFDYFLPLRDSKEKLAYWVMLKRIYLAIEDKIIEMPQEYPEDDEDSEEVDAISKITHDRAAENTGDIIKKKPFEKGERQKLRNVSRDEALACLKKFGVEEVGRSGPHTKLQRVANGKVENFPFMNIHSTDTNAFVLSKCLRRFKIYRRDFLAAL